MKMMTYMSAGGEKLNLFGRNNSLRRRSSFVARPFRRASSIINDEPSPNTFSSKTNGNIDVTKLNIRKSDNIKLPLKAKNSSFAVDSH